MILSILQKANVVGYSTLKDILYQPCQVSNISVADNQILDYLLKEDKGIAYMFGSTLVLKSEYVLEETEHVSF